MVFCCLAGARALINRHAQALLWVLLAGSASIYLGVIDITFNAGNGIYHQAMGASLWVEVVLNVLSLTLGSWGLWFGWRNRLAFLATAAP